MGAQSKYFKKSKSQEAPPLSFPIKNIIFLEIKNSEFTRHFSEIKLIIYYLFIMRTIFESFYIFSNSILINLKHTRPIPHKIYFKIKNSWFETIIT